MEVASTIFKVGGSNSRSFGLKVAKANVKRDATEEYFMRLERLSLGWEAAFMPFLYDGGAILMHTSRFQNNGSTKKMGTQIEDRGSLMTVASHPKSHAQPPIWWRALVAVSGQGFACKGHYSPAAISNVMPLTA